MYAKPKMHLISTLWTVSSCIIALMPEVSAKRVRSVAMATATTRATCNVLRTGFHDGFHRDVQSNITITFEQPLLSESTCEVLLKEFIPTGLYVDLYQTENLHHFGGPKVYSLVDIDVELPEYKSEAYVVYVYNAATRSDVSSLQSNITIPVHVRYHRPSAEDDYASVVLPIPDVMVRCGSSNEWIETLSEADVVAAPCSDDPSSDCAWIRLACTGAQSLIFQIPVGKLSHYALVVVVTTLVTLTATIVLVNAMLRQRPPPEEHAKKTS